MAKLFRRSQNTNKKRDVQNKTRGEVRGRYADLDELAKLNRGGFTAFGEDVGEQPAYLLPFSRVMRDENLLGQPMLRQPVQLPEFDVPEQSYTPEPIPEFSPSIDVSNAEGFLNEFDRAFQYANPYQPGEDRYTPGQQAVGIQQLADGGVLFSDGIVYYSDGTYRPYDGGQFGTDPNAYPIASDPSGAVRYSDGSVRFTQTAPTGLQGLISGIFGEGRTITQEYGRYNPELEPGAGYNLGTDIRTRDLRDRSYKLPVGAEVVEVFYDDGTQWGDISGHQGYGNSVLLKLPSGEMLRFSHMDQMANLTPGTRIQPGQVFGIPGQTGNTQGEHLDLEYYDVSGNINNPENFSGFTNVGSLSTVQPKLFSSIYDPQPLGGSNVQPTTQEKQVKQEAPVVEGLKNTIKSPIQTEFGLSETITGGLDAGREARVEALSQQPSQQSPYRQLLGNVTERIGDVLGIPESGFSETIAGGTTKRTNQAFASEIGKEDEVEQVPGIRQNLTDIGKDIVGKAGAGIEKLKGLFLGASRGQSLADIGEKRAVGEESAQSSNVLPTAVAQSTEAQQTNDIRDPFFKSGQVDLFKKFLTPGAEESGALTLETFNKDFFESPEQVQSVYRGTSLAPKAAENIKNLFRTRYAGSEYDQGDVEKILSGLPSDLSFTPDLRQPKKAARPTLQDYLNQGKTAAQWYAETGRQSSLDAIRKDPRKSFDDKTGNIIAVGSAPRSRFDDTGRQMSVGPQQGVTNAIRAASRGENYISPSGNVIYNYTPADANMTDASTGLPVRGGDNVILNRDKKSGLFSRISNFFRR